MEIRVLQYCYCDITILYFGLTVFTRLVYFNFSNCLSARIRIRSLQSPNGLHDMTHPLSFLGSCSDCLIFTSFTGVRSPSAFSAAFCNLQGLDGLRIPFALTHLLVLLGIRIRGDVEGRVGNGSPEGRHLGDLECLRRDEAKGLVPDLEVWIEGRRRPYRGIFENYGVRKVRFRNGKLKGGRERDD